MEVWENSKLREKPSPNGPVFPRSMQLFPRSISRLIQFLVRSRQTFTSVSITVWKHGKCFLFLNLLLRIIEFQNYEFWKDHAISRELKQATVLTTGTSTEN